MYNKYLITVAGNLFNALKQEIFNCSDMPALRLTAKNGSTLLNIWYTSVTIKGPQCVQYRNDIKSVGIFVVGKPPFWNAHFKMK